jgi:ribosomal protein S18 acetylase RimI-like enzyme
MRRAVRADVEAIRDLTRAAYAVWVPLIGREPKPMAADYGRAVDEHLIDLLFVGDRLAGLIETVPQADHLLVENVAVAPAFQGQGHGGHLLRWAERSAEAMGYGEVRLYTNRAFARNIALYLARGYRIDREEPFGDGAVVHLSKALPPA